MYGWNKSLSLWTAINKHLVFFKNGPQCENYILAILVWGGGGMGDFQWSDWTHCASHCGYPLTHINVHVRYRTSRTLPGFNPKYKNKFGGILVDPHIKFRGTRILHYEKLYQNFKQGKEITLKISYLGYYVKMLICGYTGGPGCPILFPSSPLTCINIHVTYWSNLIRIF